MIALLGDEDDSRLVRISLPHREVQRERRFGRGRPIRLAAGPGGSPVLALVRVSGGDRVAVIDPATLESVGRRPLQKGVRYSGLVVGRSGRFYAYGSRPAEAPRRFDAVLTIGELRTGTPARTHTLREAARGRWKGSGTDWYVYGAALSADERRIVVSYHGHDTTGADLFRILPAGGVSPSGRAERVCAGHPRWCRGPGIVDIPYVHGAVAAVQAGFVGAAAEAGLLRLGPEGRERRRIHVRTRSHLMDFAIDPTRARLYVSACGRRPAIHRLGLAVGGRQTVRSGRVCGKPLAVHDDRLLVLAASRVGRHGYPSLRRRPRLRLIDLERPGPGTPVGGPGEPLDALVVRSR